MQTMLRSGGLISRMFHSPKNLMPKNLMMILAGGVALMSALPTWAAQLFPLQSIDFVSQQGATKIFLHTGSIVPYRTVLISENKIVIDIDQVNSQEAVQTNFSNADNISHVVLQPLSPTTVRLIVRGENLQSPSLSFKDLRSSAQKPVQPAELADESDIITPSSLANKTPAGAEAELGSGKLDPFGEDANGPTGTIEGSQAAPPLPTKEIEPQTPDSPINLNNGFDTVVEPKEEPETDSPFAGEGLVQTLMYGLAGLLVLGAGAFIAFKLKSLQTAREGGIEPDYRQNSFPSRKNAFREMAQTYQQEQGGKPGSTKHSPIGLRGLQSPENEIIPEPPEQRQQFADAFADLAAGYGPSHLESPLPKNNVTAKKQAINQYSQNANMPPQPANKRRLTDEMLREEIHRSAEVKRQTTDNLLDSNRQRTTQAASVLRKTAAASLPKKGSGGLGGNGMNQSLPPNPEVLNFLRSVADLMDKDTKAANQINKQAAPRKNK